MNWINCISNNRTGKTNTSSLRTHYQRDFDRIIFSSSFRRLQNKTQVFPLPGNTFVHNRLTHSLEVASVGRSLGAIVGEHISSSPKGIPAKIKEFYLYDLPSVIAAGCLAHDLGNPSFGHSGEDAISNYFINNENTILNKRTLRSHFDDHEWSDLTNFEGNANAFHILTHNYTGKLEGGLSLTYATLASILKYPCPSTLINKNQKHTKKYGYLKQDYETFLKIAQNTAMVSADDTNSVYARHPFVYLVEAADDICYRVIDLEDAHRINIISTDYVEQLFLSIIKDLISDKKEFIDIQNTLYKLLDNNEKVAYLRAKTINYLVQHSTRIFFESKEQILEGTWNSTLFDEIEMVSTNLKKAKQISIEKIYNHPSVIQIEIAGYNILYELLKTFVPIVLNEKNTSLQNKIKILIPKQYISMSESSYDRVIGIVDFVAGMTDGYATEYYRKVKGIVTGSHQ